MRLACNRLRHSDGAESRDRRDHSAGARARTLRTHDGGRAMADGERDEVTALRFPILIGDIGGTNARFAIVDGAASEAGEPQIVQTADFATIDDAIRRHPRRRPRCKPRSAVLAVAGPVDGDEIPLTNCPWVVRPKGMGASVGLHDIVVLNDFEAQALAVVALGRGAHGEDRRRRAGAGAGARRARSRHRARRRRPHPCLPSLDPRARRGRPHGHRPAHGARPRGLPPHRTDRGTHFGRADPVRPRPGQHLPRRGARRRQDAALHHAGRDHRRGAGASPTRSPRRRWRCSSPASAAPPATWRWCL